ncbi:MAG: hypothetical protein JSS83_05600 [Cyanobacteria bacterium SZAS LIN-3]|nr:hypothetical protein [Cyanobacteria bacterium SZAS LIN-3]
MKTASAQNRRHFGLKAVSAGVNMALFAACAPALANGVGPHGGHSGFAGQFSQHAQSWSGGAAGAPQPIVHPHAVTGSMATSLPLANVAPVVHQSAVQSFNNNHLTNFHNNLVRPTFTSPLQNTVVAGADQVVNLDLTSSTASVVLAPGVIAHGSSATITVDGVKTTFHTGDSVTPAELVAIYQSQGAVGQKIVLDGQGRAEGGSFSLNTVLSSTHPIQVSDVVVPQNVRAFDYVSSKTNLSISGDLLNYGSIIDVSRGTTAASLSALNIVNESGGLITTVGHGAHSGVVDLSLNAAQDFTNMGTITSSGALSISAGGTITNAGTVGGGAPVLKAVNDVSLQATHVVNSGLISSALGNVNFGTSAAQDLAINNTHGTISALNGAINIRDAAYTGAGNANITGGDLLSQQLNLFSGGGTVNVNVDKLTGTVNSTGSAVHVQAHTEDLVLGTQCLVGDPTFYNDSGNIVLNGDISVGEDLAIIASGDITATAALTKIQAAAAGKGFNIVMIAGAAMTGGGSTPTTGVPAPGTKASANLTVTGGSATGGNIDLSSADPNLLITNPTTTGVNGSDITMAAFASGVFNGRIALPAKSTIDASSNGPFDGNVTLIAGARNGTAITIGGINQLSTTQSGANNVSLFNYQPVVAKAPLTFGINGSIISGQLLPDFTNKGGGDIVVNKPVDNGGTLSIAAGNNVNFGAVGATSNTGGTLITAGNDLTFSGSLSSFSVTMVAGRSISNVDPFQNITLGAFGGGNITTVSGAAFTQSAAGVQVTGASNISGAKTSLLFLSMVTDAPVGDAGNISITALGSSSGVVDLSSSTLSAAGNPGTGQNGAVTIVAGATNTTSILMPTSITSSGGLAGTGSVTLSATDATTTPVVFDGNGVIQSGTFLGGSPAANSVFTANGITLQGGNLTIIQDKAVSITTPTFATGTVGILSIYGGQGVTLSSSVNANQVAIFSNGNIQLGAGTNLTNPGGVVLVSGHDVTTSAAGIAIDASSATDAGAILVAAGASFTLTDGVTSITGASATGGKIDFATKAISTFKSQGTAGNGGNETLLAFNGSDNTGSIALPSAVSISTAGAKGKTNGNFLAVAGAAKGAAMIFGDIDASTDTKSNPNPSSSGSITLQSATPDTSAPLVFSPGGVLTSGSPFNNAIFDTQADIVTGNLTNSGGIVSIASSRDVQIGTINVSNTATGGIGGTAAVVTHGDQNLEIGGAPTGANFIGVVNASGDAASGQKGVISITNADSNSLGNIGISLKALNVLVNAGSTGGTLSLQTGASSGDTIDFGANNSIDYSAGAASGSGGLIDIAGFDVVFTGAKLSLSANAGATGNAGSISFRTATSAALDLTKTSPFQFSANGGSGTAAGGLVSIERGGSITFDPAGTAINVAPGSAPAGGSGGSIVIKAGFFDSKAIGLGNSTLLVTGPLSVAATGVKGNNGGNITLASNSAIPFNIGLVSGNLNGVQGTVSVAGNPLSANGSVTFNNANGGVITSTAMTKVGTVNIESDGPGAFITIGAPLGTPATSPGKTSFIELDAQSSVSASITQSNTKAIIAADILSVNSGSAGTIGGKTALLVNAASVSAVGGSLVNVSDSAAAVDLSGGAAGSFTFVATAPNATLTVNGSGIFATNNVTLTAAKLDLQSDVNAFAFDSKVNLTATTGDLHSDVGTNIFGGVISLTASKGLIDVDVVGDNSQTSSITMNALNSISVFDADAINSVSLKTTSTAAGEGDITVLDEATAVNAAGGVVTLSASGGIDGTGALFQGGKSVTLTAKGNIDANFILSLGTVTITAGGAVGSNGISTSNVINIKGTDIAFFDDIIATAVNGVVTLTATQGDIVSSSGINIASGKSLTMTASKGLIDVGEIGDFVTASVSLSALKSINIDGSVLAINSITAKTTSKVAGEGTINVTGDLSLFSTTSGVLSLNASGAGTGASSAILVQGDIEASKSVSLTSKGDIHIGSIGAKFTSPATVTLSAVDNIVTDNVVHALKSISMKTTATTGLDGTISLGGTVAALSPSGSVSLVASGTSLKTDQISISNPTVDISAGKSVVLTAAKGHVAVGTIGLSVATSKVSLTGLIQVSTDAVQATGSITETVTAKTGGIGIIATDDLSVPSAGGTISLSAGSGAITTLGDLSAGKSVTAVSKTGGMLVNTVGNKLRPGTLSLTAGQSLSTFGAVKAVSKISLLSTSASNKDDVMIADLLDTSNGSISIIGGGGGISVTKGAQILANSTSAKTKATILIEASDKINGKVNLTSANIATSGPGGGDVNIAVGAPSKGIVGTPPAGGTVNVKASPGFNVFFGPAGAVTNANVTTLTAKNANLIFSAPAGSKGVINLDGMTITADPPTAPAAHVLVATSTVNTDGVVMPAAAAAVQLPSLPAQSLVSSSAIAPLTAFNVASLTQSRTLQGVVEQFAPASASARYRSGGYNWISETEIDGGEIPVALHTDAALAVEGTSGAALERGYLAGGTVLSIPKSDTTIKTRHGEVSVAAGSMVLVMALENGLAVYNLDDVRSDAVVVRAAGSNMVVRPGTSVVITSEKASSFAHVNPAQLLCYRRISERQLDQGMKAYRAEFAMQSAIAAVKPLKSMILSQHKETSRVATHFLKTLSILLQLQSSGESFKQVLKPQLTASAR